MLVYFCRCCYIYIDFMLTVDNPSYKQLDEFVAKCVREHKV